MNSNKDPAPKIRQGALEVAITYINMNGYMNHQSLQVFFPYFWSFDEAFLHVAAVRSIFVHAGN